MALQTSLAWKSLMDRTLIPGESFNFQEKAIIIKFFNRTIFISSMLIHQSGYAYILRKGLILVDLAPKYEINLKLKLSLLHKIFT